MSEYRKIIKKMILECSILVHYQKKELLYWLWLQFNICKLYLTRIP